ncbi:MAG: peptidylprolyl isomerase, partial [Bacteroidota bacterium]
MRKWMFLSLLCALFASQAQAQDRQIIDKVVGKVGSELILLSEIEDQFDLLRQQRGTLEPEFRCNVLENLLAQNLLLNQARLDSIVIANEEIDAQLDARFERILAYMNNDVKQFEAYYGQTVNEVREQFREDLRSKLMVDRMRANILQGINVTPSEVKTFFKSIPTDSLPYFNSEVEVGEIVYKPKVNEEQKNIAIKQLEDIQQRIKEGEPFEELAKKYSMDPGSGRVGGDLGWQKRGTFVPEFEAAAYNLEKGQYSEIIETEFGYHLLQLIERRGNTIRVRHILIKPEITDADLKKAQNVLDSIRSLILP